MKPGGFVPILGGNPVCPPVDALPRAWALSMSMKDKRRDHPAGLVPGIQESLSRIAGTAVTYPGLTPESRHIPAMVRDLCKKLAVFAYRLQTRDLWIVFLGGTGTGKSTLFNAFTGKELSRTGVERPKTTGPIAYAPRDSVVEGSFPFPEMELERRPADDRGVAPAEGVPNRLLLLEHDRDAFAGWIVVDTPDLDSVEVKHRRMSEDLYLLSDVVVFVSSQEKYADEVPYGFLRRVVRDDRPCYLLLNKASPELSAEEVRQTLQKDGVSLPEGALTLIPYAPSRPVESVSRSPAFRDFLDGLRQKWSPIGAEPFRKAGSERSASELVPAIERLSRLLDAERLAGVAWRRRLEELHETVWQELVQEEKRRFSEQSRRYLGREIRRLFSRYDVLARPRKIMGDILLAPLRMVGLIRREKAPDPEDALAKVRDKTDLTPVLSAVERLNRRVLETLSSLPEESPMSAKIRQRGVALEEEEIRELIRENQADLMQWLEGRFRELAAGIPAGKKWGIYSTSILWGLLILSLEGVVGGGFTVLDAVLGSSLAPFVTKGAVEVFAYAEIQKAARELSKRYQDGLLAVLSLQRDRYVQCLEPLLPPEDVLKTLKDLLRRLKAWRP